MNKKQKEKLIRVNQELINEGNEVIETQFRVDIIGSPTYVDSRTLYKWWGKVKSFNYQLGTAAKPWQEVLTSEPERNTLIFVTQVLGTLEAIKHELENDHLDTLTQLIRAKTMADLLEQGQHLFDNAYYLAAGVIGRAVLEEHLRNLCEDLKCYPTKDRPTINDYNMELYKKEHYSKTKMKHIDVLASIGNNAAHNLPELDASEVKKLLSEIPEIIESTKL
jgi:hypothetical protein